MADPRLSFIITEPQALADPLDALAQVVATHRGLAEALTRAYAEAFYRLRVADRLADLDYDRLPYTAIQAARLTERANGWINPPARRVRWADPLRLARTLDLREIGVVDRVAAARAEEGGDDPEELYGDE